VLNHRNKNLPNWKQIIVSDTTINQYVKPPEVYYTLGKTHKSDWLRLALLQKYGGCWMDASIIVNRETELNMMYEQSIHNQYEMTGFYTPLGVINNDPSSFIESWCLMAPRNSRVINTWLEEFEKACTQGFDVYKKESMKEHTFSPHIYNPAKEDDVYLTVYAACQITLQKRLRNEANVSLYNSYETMYKLHYECWDDEKKDYDHDCIVLRLRDDPSAKKIPFIKLTGHTRKFIEKVDMSSFFRPM
jgi:hypothetical protein